MNAKKPASYADKKIKVPFGVKTLTINSDAFTTLNATHISALANCEGNMKYTVLGTVNNSINIDLLGILNTNNVGSSVNVSFYAEHVNTSGVSDRISQTPVAIEIEVVEIGKSSFVYNAGGGVGSVPQRATASIGRSYSMADGSSLTKDENNFSSWRITYTEYGTNNDIEKFAKSGESIIVPFSANGTITATVTYSGISVIKSTEEKFTGQITVTYDTNAPDGVDDIGIAYIAKFDDSLEGKFSTDRTKLYDKSKKNFRSLPEGPTNLNFITYTFDGWYTDPINGEELTMTIFVDRDVTYYVHWTSTMTSFLAPKTESHTTNPKKIQGVRHDIAQVQTEARDIATNGINSQYYSKYNEWMNNDSYRLYSLLNGKDPDDADSWVEFRIVHVGQHVSDGTGLTFQAVHMLPTAYQMNSTKTSVGGWHQVNSEKKCKVVVRSIVCLTHN